MNIEKKISIIIPHYNAPKKLERLLESIPNSQEIEIIVIDDRSTLYLDQYELLKRNNENRNILFLKNNTPSKGAGAARNIGLKYAKGEWLLFADSDDFFVKDAFLLIMKVIKKFWETKSDVIFFTPTSIIENSNREAHRHILYKKLIDDYLKHKENSELFLRYGYRSPCSKLIRRKLILDHKIAFSETIVCNDDFFSVQVGFCAKNIYASRQTIYCIEESPTSLSRKKGKEYSRPCFEETLKIDSYLKNMLDKKDYEILSRKFSFSHYVIGN